jgi:cytidylate kinase
LIRSHSWRQNDQNHHHDFTADGRRWSHIAANRQAPVSIHDRGAAHRAKEFGCDEETIAARSERVTSFWERVLGGLSFGAPEAAYSPPPLGNFSDRELFEKQTQILKRIASQEDCVVVGWAGVFMLPRHRGMFSVFCHAPKSFRCKRLMNIYQDLNDERARTLIVESDRTREIYFNEMTASD